MNGRKTIRRTGIAGIIIVALTAMNIVLFAPPAFAGNCFAEAFFSRPNTSTGKAKARAYCTTGDTIIEIHVYARLYRTDTTPATTLGSNSRTCELSQFCPADGFSFVSVTGGLKAGCHTYQARTGGYVIYRGMPVQAPFTAVYNSDVYQICI